MDFLPVDIVIIFSLLLETVSHKVLIVMQCWKLGYFAKF